MLNFLRVSDVILISVLILFPT